MFRGSRKKTKKSTTNRRKSTTSAKRSTRSKNQTKRAASGRTSTRKRSTTSSKTTRKRKSTTSKKPARMRINGSLMSSAKPKRASKTEKKPTRSTQKSTDKPKKSTISKNTSTRRKSTTKTVSSRKASTNTTKRNTTKTKRQVAKKATPTVKRRLSNTFTAKIDRRQFYQKYRQLFVNKLSQKQVDGFEALMDYFEAKKLKDKRYLAYCLATAYHETGAKMQPVREGFSKTDAGSIRAVRGLFRKKVISNDYSKKHANGKSYFGRGYVQITHGTNYKRVGRAIGLGNQLYSNPSLALKTDIGVKILFTGMLRGLFTGRKLKRYFNSRTTDWVNARRIINGTDKASLIANYAIRFRKCLEKG